MKTTKKISVIALLVCGTVIFAFSGCTFTAQTETTTATTAQSQPSDFQGKRNQGNQQLSVIYGQVSLIEGYNLTLFLADIAATDSLAPITEELPNADAVSNIIKPNIITVDTSTFVNPFTLTGESQSITFSESTLIGTVNLETGESNSAAALSDITVDSYLQVQLSSDGSIYAIVVLQFTSSNNDPSIDAVSINF